MVAFHSTTTCCRSAAVIISRLPITGSESLPETDLCRATLVVPAGARKAGLGLPDGFSFHDLRHYLASLLIASGADIKTVRARMRHASARTTLDTYGHLWPEADESTRAAVDVVIKARLAGAETSCGPTAVPDP